MAAGNRKAKESWIGWPETGRRYGVVEECFCAEMGEVPSDLVRFSPIWVKFPLKTTRVTETNFSAILLSKSEGFKRLILNGCPCFTIDHRKTEGQLLTLLLKLQ